MKIVYTYKFLYSRTWLLPLLFIIVSCNPTKFVPENKQLLEKTKIELENSKINKKELKSYLKQRPNKRILGVRFHLWLYNRSRKNKDNGFNNWLRKIGEEPVIYDPLLTSKTTRQLQLYLHKKGYYQSIVENTVSGKKKAKVTYHIVTNQPYRIHTIDYQIEDTSIKNIIYADTIHSLLHTGIIFDEYILQNERTRIERMMKNRGYYKFSKEYIYYKADSTIGLNKVNITTGIKKNVEFKDDRIRETLHHIYYIRDVYVYAESESKKEVDLQLQKDSLPQNWDTLKLNDITFYYPKGKKKQIKPQIIGYSIFLNKDRLYRLKDVEETYKHLLSLKIFKYINIYFEEANDTAHYLDCYIQLSQLKNQSYTLEIEGTNSSGNIGAGGNVIYQHKNLFKGAEIFNIKLTGAMEAIQESKIQDPESPQSSDNTRDLNNTLELGAEAGILIPRFLLPVKTEGFVKKFNPKTSISTAYNYHSRPEYTRTIANASFGYTWRGNNYTTHTINPLKMDAVKIFDMNQEFYASLPEILKSSYEDHFVAVTSYSFIFTNQNIKKNTDFVYFRINLESAGNLLTLMNNSFGSKKTDDYYTIFKTQYSQYIRSDIDLRYSSALNETDKMVYRLYMGLGYPYGNSKALPFEKKFFSGGANSIRAWQVKSLGPGSLYEDSLGRYPNQIGDIKLEANMEYRFDLFWVLEGALFLDMGNIWEISLEEGREEAYFKLNKFYEDIAVGTGFGMRFDFSFFIFRFDIGLKLRDPLLNIEGSTSKWIIDNRSFKRDDLGFNIGIGYPF